MSAATPLSRYRQPAAKRTGTGSAEPVSAPSEAAVRPEPVPAPVSDLTRERFFKLIYTEVRTRILNGEVKPTVRPVTDAVTEVIRHHTKVLGLQPSLIGKPERQKIAEKILEKLEREMVLELNPQSGVGKSKYLLASRWAQPACTGNPAGGASCPVNRADRLTSGYY